MLRWLTTSLFLLSIASQAIACSYCRTKAPASPTGPVTTNSTTSGGGMVVTRGAAPKAAVNFNDPIILSVDKERDPASERGTFEMSISGGYAE